MRAPQRGDVDGVDSFACESSPHLDGLADAARIKGRVAVSVAQRKGPIRMRRLRGPVADQQNRGSPRRRDVTHLTELVGRFAGRRLRC